MALVGVSFSMEMYYNDRIMWPGGYVEVTFVTTLVLDSSGWSPCLILMYWSFVSDWWLVVF